MIELVHERTVGLRDVDSGLEYDRARVYAERQDDGRWGGFIEFVSADGGRLVRTERETTQRNVADVAGWATGLEAVYFEGALDRALRAASPEPDAPAVAAPVGPRIALIEVESTDPTVALAVMGTRTLIPGQRRRIQDVASLTYTGTVRAPTEREPGRYGFVVEFGSDNAAALVANFLWTALHGQPASVIVNGVTASVTNSALKATLLGTAA